MSDGSGATAALWALMSIDTCEVTRALAMRCLCALLVAESRVSVEKRKGGRLASFLSTLSIVRVTQVSRTCPAGQH